MYAGLIARKGGVRAASAAAAAANNHIDNLGSDRHDDTAKQLNSDGSFGDPKPKFQVTGRVPQPWICPNTSCQRNNFQWRKSCPHCNSSKPSDHVEFINANEAKNDCNTSLPAAAPVPEEVARGNQTNANLQGLGVRKPGARGGCGGGGGETMAERLARMAGMTGMNLSDPGPTTSPDTFARPASVVDKKPPSLMSVTSNDERLQMKRKSDDDSFAGANKKIPSLMDLDDDKPPGDDDETVVKPDFGSVARGGGVGSRGRGASFNAFGSFR